MGILGLTISVQPIIGLHYSSYKNCSYPIQLFPQLQHSATGSTIFRLKTKKNQSFSIVRASAEGTNMSTTIEKLGVKIERNPTESKLSELGVRDWPKWGCAPSKFPWTYDAKETCYLLKGKVKVYPEGSNEAVEFGAGDLVVFPKGMSCTWDVSEAVDKHYKFE
ncbi:Ethanolamine utilization protein EutQ [Bienertia sinuspersici]